MNWDGVVKITPIPDKVKESTSSAFFVGSNYLLMCKHGLLKHQHHEDAEIAYRFANNNKAFIARVLKISKDFDLVLLRTETEAPIVYELVDDMRYGEMLQTGGFPYDSLGLIAGLLHPVYIQENEIQLGGEGANNILWGFSGAPICDQDFFAKGIITGASLRTDNRKCGVCNSKQSHCSGI